MAGTTAAPPAPPPRGRARAPAWDRSRPYLTHGALRASAAAAAVAPRPAPDPPLATYPQAAQDAVAADDVLSALLGVPGAFVRARLVAVAGAPRPGAAADAVVFDFQDGGGGGGGVEASVPALAQRLLVLADDHAAVAAFVEGSRVAAEAGGYVRQALGVAVGELLEDYRMFVLRLERELRAGQLSLQRLLYAVQPSMRSMALLRRVAESVDGRAGGAALDAVYQLATAHVGGADTRAVLAFVVGRTATPILDCTAVWMSRGLIDDKYKEFFVEENSRFGHASMRDDPTSSKSWELRYTINRDNVPSFLAPFVEKILRAGKYLNVLRESAVVLAKSPTAPTQTVVAPVGAAEGMDAGGNGSDSGLESVRMALSGDVLLGPDASRSIAVIVDRAYLFSSSMLIADLRDRVNVLARLQSIKRYFMLEQGDFMVHFFDAAADELDKHRAEVSVGKLSSLLELSVRTSVSASDPYHDDLSCVLCETDLTSQILSALGSDSRTTSTNGGPGRANVATSACPENGEAPALSGYDTFSLDYKVTWPMNLIVSGMEILKYQLLFRYFFHCKYVERELERCWRSLAQVKARNRVLSSEFARTFALRHRMLQFLRSFLYYVVADVLEPNWQKFLVLYENSKTIDEIMVHHAAFLDVCLSQCLLSNERHLRVFHSVTKISLLFAKYCDGFTAGLSNGTPAEEISKSMRERSYGATIAKFEKSFDANLRQVLDGLSTMSKKRASTNLANLCDALDSGGFYEREAVRSAANLEL